MDSQVYEEKWSKALKRQSSPHVHSSQVLLPGVKKRMMKKLMHRSNPLVLHEFTCLQGVCSQRGTNQPATHGPVWCIQHASGFRQLGLGNFFQKNKKTCAGFLQSMKPTQHQTIMEKKMIQKTFSTATVSC